MARRKHREIERKFLVRKLPPYLRRYPHRKIEQGYLAAERGMQVRLRRAGEKTTLTYKRDDPSGRIEREVEITPAQFEVLWPATQRCRLTKTRYDVPFGAFMIEVDIYSGRHKGLVVAEVEFENTSAARRFNAPDWLGRDVSGSARYSNVRLAFA